MNSRLKKLKKQTMARIKRRRPKQKRNYFTHEAEDAILLFNKTDNAVKVLMIDYIEL